MNNQHTTTSTDSAVDHVRDTARIRAEAPGRRSAPARVHHLSSVDFARTIRESAPGRRVATNA